jgi:phage shock protein B
MHAWEQLASTGDIVPVMGILAGILISFFVTAAIFILGFIKLLRSGGSKKERQLDADEARMFQELQRGFQKMEQRVDALETLILDRERGRTTQRP